MASEDEFAAPDLASMKQARLHDLDLTLISELLRKEELPNFRGLDDPAFEKILVRQKMMYWDGAYYCPTLAGLVMFGHSPYRHLPGLRVDTHIYGVRDIWEDSVDELLLRMTDIPHMPLNGALTVFRDLMCNALLHRSWENLQRNQPIKLVVTERRLELSSPGKLVPDMRLGRSTPVNPTLFEFARRLGLAPGRGLSLQRFSNYMEMWKARPFNLIQQGDRVHLIAEWPRNTYSVPPWPMDSKRGFDWRKQLTLEPQARPAPMRRGDNSAVTPIQSPPWSPVSSHPEASSPSMRPETKPGLSDAMVRGREASDEAFEAEPETASSPLPDWMSLSGWTPPAILAEVTESAAETPDDESDDNNRLSLEERQALLLTQLRDRGPQSTRGLMEALDWKRGTTRNVLDSLLEEGSIRSLAESARSPHQLYELT